MRHAWTGLLLVALTVAPRARGDEATEVEKLVAKGERLWSRSCPVAGLQGLCLRDGIARGVGARRCGPAKTIRRTVARHQGQARAARKLLEQALARTAGKSAPRLRGAATRARFLLADQRLDEFLQLAFPAGLDFSTRRERSMRAFAGYIDRKGKLLLAAMQDYQELVKLGDPLWSVASIARIGQLYQHFADALATAPVSKPPVPRSLAGPQARAEFAKVFTETYCDALLDKALPLESRAVEGYRSCQTRARELGVEQDEWAALCTRELARIRAEGVSSRKPGR